VNYLAPYLLTQLLIGRLAESRDARVITTSSAAYSFAARMDLDDLSNNNRRFRSLKAYAASKLGNILFTQELARRTRGTSVTASTFHPGPVATDFFRDGGWFGALLESPIGRRLQVTPDQGAAPLTYLATVADPQSVNGAYFNRMKRAGSRRPRSLTPTSPVVSGTAAPSWLVSPLTWFEDLQDLQTPVVVTD
jgi:NAD(P)-dependent dehydrogenase (short-subunit alcohol dehydrogenase family)